MQRIRQKNPPNFERRNSAKIAGKILTIGKQFWQVTVKVDSNRYKENIARHTRPIG